jgi:hypothetical protein
MTPSLFTEQEQVKLHCRFGHPGSQKLYDFYIVLRRITVMRLRGTHWRISLNVVVLANPHDLPRASSMPVSLTTALCSIQKYWWLYSSWTDARPVLSVVCRDTRFQSPMVLPDGTKAIDVWHALLRCWVYRFSGAPDSIRHNAGVQFIAQEFQTLAGEMGIRCQPIPVEGPHSLGIGEICHGALRRPFERLFVAHPDASSELLLDAYVKAANDLMGPDGLVRTLFVFDVYPKLPLKVSSSAAVPY